MFIKLSLLLFVLYLILSLSVLLYSLFSLPLLSLCLSVSLFSLSLTHTHTHTHTHTLFKPVLSAEKLRKDNILSSVARQPTITWPAPNFYFFGALLLRLYIIIHTEHI